MAVFYWVGGNNTWDSTYTGKWSTTSGGAATWTRVPTLGDTVYFDAASGTVTVTPAGGFTVTILDFTGFTGNFTGAGNNKVQGASGLGLFKLNPTMNYSHTGQLTLDGSSAGQSVSVDFAGQVKQGGTIIFNSTGSPGGVINLQSDLIHLGPISQTGGVLNTNGYRLSGATYTSTASGATLNLSTSKLLLAGSGSVCNMHAASTFSSSAGAEIRLLNGNNPKTFLGNGRNYGNTVLAVNLTNQPAVVSGSNTLGLRTFGVGQLGALQFTLGTTQTLTSWNVNGRAAGTVMVSPDFMLFNNAPSPYVITATEYQPPYAGFRAFDGDPNTFAHSLNALTTEAWVVKIDLGFATQVSSYVVQARSGGVNHSFKNWTLEGSDNDSTWSICDTRVNEPNMTSIERRTYTCTTPATFRYWRWVVTASWGTHAEVGALELYGTIAAQLVVLSSTMPGSQSNFVSSAAVNSVFINVKDNAASGNTFAAGVGSIDSGNNTGWTFPPPVVVQPRAIIMA